VRKLREESMKLREEFHVMYTEVLKEEQEDFANGQTLNLYLTPVYRLQLSINSKFYSLTPLS
jgi:hypothetical protein